MSTRKADGQWNNRTTSVTVCKLKVCERAIVLRSYALAVINNGQINERKETYFYKTKTNRGASAAAWFQGGIHFGQFRIRRWRTIQACSWKSLSRYIAFFGFLAPVKRIFFSYWLLIHLEMKHCLLRFLRDDWDEILPSIRMKFIDFLVWSWLCFAFYTRTFLRSGAFRDDNISWFRKQLSSVNTKC